VHGGDSVSSFLLEGYTSVVKLREALKTVAKKDWGDFRQILDWGCGCGRLTRHLADPAPARLAGVDIDRDNIAWCRKNLPFASFACVRLRPPTGLDSGRYDLIVGLSGFSHMPATEQAPWLAQQSRGDAT